MSLLRCVCAWLLPALGAAQAEMDIPDKVGAEVHMTKAERKVLKKLECPMCKAIISELQIEVEKHRMTSGGVGSESQVWETSNAICLGIMQKWRLDLQQESFVKKPEDEEDEEFMMREPHRYQEHVRSMLVLKMGCSQWVEDYGGESSGFVFKSVRDKSYTPQEAAREFCKFSVNLCGKSKEKRKKEVRDKERERLQERAERNRREDEKLKEKGAENPMNSLPDDSKLGLQRMLEMARDDPLHWLEEKEKERIREAQKGLRCSVCLQVFQEVSSQLPKRKVREYDILPFLEGACEGGKDLSVPSYFGVEPPPLPPAWTDKVRPRKSKEGEWRLVAFPKKAGKARAKWRQLSETGQQKPPPDSEGEGDLMMTLACKDVVEAERMAEILFKERERCEGCDAALAAARSFCRAADSAACDFGREEL